MWLLGRLLPLMCGEGVPEEDEHWQNYLLLLKIMMNYLFSPVIVLTEWQYLIVIMHIHHVYNYNLGFD